METTTARVDLQRLQLLSDRLAQTLDALNHVRITAQSVTTEPAFVGQRPELRTPFMPWGMNTIPYGNPYYGVNSHAYNPYIQGMHPFGGLNSVYGGLNSVSVNPFSQPMGYQTPVYTNGHQAVNTQFAQAPIW